MVRCCHRPLRHVREHEVKQGPLFFEDLKPDQGVVGVVVFRHEVDDIDPVAGIASIDPIFLDDYVLVKPHFSLAFVFYHMLAVWSCLRSEPSFFTESLENAGSDGSGGDAPALRLV